MNKGFFPRLAADNIRKNAKTYIPYIITCTVTVMMYYLIKSLASNPALINMGLGSLLIVGSGVVALFAIIFLFYTNSFLVKRRKKEFGLFHILGMEKRHLAKTLAWETLYVAAISIGGGLLLGIALDKLMFLLITHFSNQAASLGFFLSPKVVGHTAGYFLLIFLLIYANSVRQIQTSSPIALMQDSHAGEREPKAKWFLALLGFVCIGAGYYYARTTKDAISAIGTFFGAVALVMVGTYLLFTAGSIAILKLMRKNKRFYYQPDHFISVSGLLYRMKQNAVGLANICILSTMVLIIISSTGSMVLGIQDVIQSRYPNDFCVYLDGANADATVEEIHTLQANQNFPVQDELQYSYLFFPCSRSKDNFIVSTEGYGTDTAIVMPLSDYNRIMDTTYQLAPEEILLVDGRTPYDYPTLNLFDSTYTIKEKADAYPPNGVLASFVFDSYYLVVSDSTLADWNAAFVSLMQNAEEGTALKAYYGFDTSADAKSQLAFSKDMLNASIPSISLLEVKTEAHDSFVGLYSGFFFIGVFLGILFLMATVLIIYYKQITEGFDDRDRYKILRQVGMSSQEIKSTIHSQIITVFFLPLAVAGLHVIAAYPLMVKLLAMLNLLNRRLFFGCTVSCYLVFAAFYLLVYLLTAKVYYKIVSQ